MLKPEFNTGYDAGIARSLNGSRTQFSLSVFDNSYKNIIDFSPSLFKLVNREDEFARGVDLDVCKQLRSVTVSGAVTYLDAGFHGTSERLDDVPRWSEEFDARMQLPRRFVLELETAWIGRRFDYQVPVPQITFVPRYSTTNIVFQKELGRAIRSEIRLENAWNSRYQEFVGFHSPGIYASAGIRYSR
jgi:outer membrane cobalamin receptor